MSEKAPSMQVPSICEVEEERCRDLNNLFKNNLYKRHAEEATPDCLPTGGGSDRMIIARPAAMGINRGRQEGNPVLKYIRTVPYQWTPTKADFDLGSGACCLYLSLKWHKLHPSYIETRFKEVARSYTLQVLLAVVNIEEPRHILRELNMFCFRAGWTLILCYSVEEAGEYLESFKLTERKMNEMVSEMTKRSHTVKKETEFSVDKDKRRLCDAALQLLASVRSISRTDAQRLIGAFGSLKNIFQASVDQLCLCPGLGLQKAKRLHHAIRQPFILK